MAAAGASGYRGAMLRIRTSVFARLGALLLALVALSVPGRAPAQQLLTEGDGLLSVEPLVGRALADGSRLAGLRLTIASGWKTYWRNPGAVGVPPRFDWSGSENLASAEVLFPRPQVISSFGLETLGYGGEVVWPVRLVPEDASRPIRARLRLEAGVCQDICVFANKEVVFAIEPGTGDGPAAALVDRALAAVPPEGGSLGLPRPVCRISGAGRKRRFEAEVELGRPLEGLRVAVEGPENVWFQNVVGESRADGRLSVAADMSLLDEGAWVKRSDVILTVLAEGFAVEFRGCTGSTG